MLFILGDRRISVCRELTKIHEEVFRGSLSQAIEHFREPKGEFTLIIEGRKKGKPLLTDDIEKELRKMHLAGITAKEALARIARQTGLPRRELYQAWLRQL